MSIQLFPPLVHLCQHSAHVTRKVETRLSDCRLIHWLTTATDPNDQSSHDTDEQLIPTWHNNCSHTHTISVSRHSCQLTHTDRQTEGFNVRWMRNCPLSQSVDLSLSISRPTSCCSRPRQPTPACWVPPGNLLLQTSPPISHIHTPPPAVTTHVCYFLSHVKS